MGPKRLVGRLAAAAIDLMLPHRCAACQRPLQQHWPFCSSCGASLLPLRWPCPRCGLPRDGPASACLQRQDHRAFDSAQAPLLYGGALALALGHLKFGRAPQVARSLSLLIAPLARPLARQVDLAVAVPLHPRRLRRRGYNQAALIARHLVGLLRAQQSPPKSSAPRLDPDAVRRTRDTAPQAQLPRRLRLINPEGAFTALPGRVAGARVLLIDDVMTTGATAAACAAALRSAGAARIDVLTVARALP